LLCSPVPPSGAGRYVSTRWAVVNGPPADQPISLGQCVAQEQLRAATRFRSGKDPPRSCPVEVCALDADWSSQRGYFADGAHDRFLQIRYGGAASAPASCVSLGP
jgi:hypothetical protein